MNASTTKKTTSLRLNADLYALIERIAKRENRSVNNYIETILLEATGYYEATENEKEEITKRADEYRKNPNIAIPYEMVKNNIKGKYGI